MAKLSHSEISKLLKSAGNLPKVYTRGFRRLEEHSEPDSLPRPPEYIDQLFEPESFPDCQPSDEPLHHFEKLAAFRARHPFFEDRSVKAVFISARCPSWLKDDFEFLCRTCEGEDPAVVVRRLVRDYVRENTPE